MVTIRKTIEIAMLVLCACGPTTPAGGVRAAGGVDPIVCYRSALHVCRDGVGSFWICDTGESIHCVRAEEPSKVFAPIRAEHAP